MFGNDQFFQLAAHRLGDRPTEQPLGLSVPIEDLAAGVELDHSVERSLDDRALFLHTNDEVASSSMQIGVVRFERRVWRALFRISSMLLRIVISRNKSSNSTQPVCSTHRHSSAVATPNTDCGQKIPRIRWSAPTRVVATMRTPQSRYAARKASDPKT